MWSFSSGKVTAQRVKKINTTTRDIQSDFLPNSYVSVEKRRTWLEVCVAVSTKKKRGELKPEREGTVDLWKWSVNECTLQVFFLAPFPFLLFDIWTSLQTRVQSQEVLWHKTFSFRTASLCGESWYCSENGENLYLMHLVTLGLNQSDCEELVRVLHLKCVTLGSTSTLKNVCTLAAQNGSGEPKTPNPTRSAQDRTQGSQVCGPRSAHSCLFDQNHKLIESNGFFPQPEEGYFLKQASEKPEKQDERRRPSSFDSRMFLKPCTAHLRVHFWGLMKFLLEFGVFYFPHVIRHGFRPLNGNYEPISRLPSLT